MTVQIQMLSKDSFEELIRTRQPSHVFVQGFKFTSAIVTILQSIDTAQRSNLLKVMRTAMMAASGNGRDGRQKEG